MAKRKLKNDQIKMDDKPEKTSDAQLHKKHICTVCDKSFGKLYNMYRHQTKMHDMPKPVESNSEPISCGYEGCAKSCKTVQVLRTHLQDAHNIESKTEERTFQSEEEFLNWKDNLEVEEQVNYTQMSGRKRREDKIVKYFYCNRSGKYSSRTTGKRKVIKRPTCKIQSHCTATLKMVKDVFTGRVEVTRCASHYNHNIELKHLRLSSSTKLNVVEQIKQGVDADTILYKTQNGFGGTSNRDKLLTAKDIRNIERSYRIQSARKYKDDSTSMKSFVENMQQLGIENPVIGCKFHLTQEEDTEINNLSKNDFFLGLFHPIQINMLKTFSSRIICVDVLYETNAYNFMLITVLVLDEVGESIPVAWLISNKDDHTTLAEFFMFIRKKIGIVKCQYFMSDISPQYFSAWISIFGTGPTKLLIPWHVDKAWRKNLTTIRDFNIQEVVYQRLRAVMVCDNEQKLLEMICSVREDLLQNELTNEFGKYFNTNYASQLEQWATYYRRLYLMSTNIQLDAFHNSLKYQYLNGKSDERLDNLIHILLKMVRDKYFDRLAKINNGNLTTEISSIGVHHRVSYQMDLKLVTKFGANEFCVRSTNSANEYRVQISNQKCAIPDCQLNCAVCKLCVHEASCTCREAIVRGLLCEHIHLAVRFTNQKHDKQSSNKRTLQKAKEDLQSLLNEVGQCIESCNNQQQLSELETMLTNCHDFMQMVPIIPALSTNKRSPKKKSPISIKLPEQPVPLEQPLTQREAMTVNILHSMNNYEMGYGSYG